MGLITGLITCYLQMYYQKKEKKDQPAKGFILLASNVKTCDILSSNDRYESVW